MRLFIALLVVFCAAVPSWADAPDATAGKAVFGSSCSICHAVQPGVNKIGPSLAGVYGRAAGSLPGYSYSAAMKNANHPWDQATLTVFLQNPRQAVPGTKMAYPGQHDPDKVAALIAYLASLKQ